MAASEDNEAYLAGLQNLQYDLLYGERFSYNGEDLYPASDLVMGIDEVTLSKTLISPDKKNLYIYGNNFTNWSKVFVNDEKVSTTFYNNGWLSISLDSISDGDVITVCQMGSSNTVFRTSENELTYVDEEIPVADTEAELPTEAIDVAE